MFTIDDDFTIYLKNMIESINKNVNDQKDSDWY